MVRDRMTQNGITYLELYSSLGLVNASHSLSMAVNALLSLWECVWWTWWSFSHGKANGAVLLSSNIFFWSGTWLAKVILLEDGANSWPPDPGQSTEVCQMLVSLLQKKIFFSQFAVEQAGQETYRICQRQHLVKFRGKNHLLPTLSLQINGWET